MKTIKTNLLNNIFKAVLFLFCASLLACSGLNGVSDSGDESYTSSSGVSSGVSSSSGMAYISSVSFGNGERTILPGSSFDLKGEGIYKFVLKRRAEGGEEESFTPWTPSTDEDGYFVSAYDNMDNALRDGSVSLGPGAYIFTIQVYVLPEGVSYTDENADSQAFPVLEKTTEEPVTLVSGNNRIRFGVLNEASGNGKLSLRLRFPDEGVTNVKVRMDPQGDNNTYSVAEKSLTIAEAVGGYRSVLFSDEQPRNGWYIVKFTFTINNGAGETTQVYNEFVQIATGRKTEAERTIDSLNALFPITYNYKGGRPVSNDIPGSYSPYQGSIPMPELQPRNGATFDGWYSDSQYRNRVSELASGSTGAKTFYAKWKYNVEGGVLYAGGAKVIVQEENDTVTRAYFDSVNDDNVVLAADGGPINILGYKIYGSKKDGTYPDGTTDDITVNSGRVSNIYASGDDRGHVTVNGGTVAYIEYSGNGGSVNINGGTIVGDIVDSSSNKYAIYTKSTNSSLNLTGGTITGIIDGDVDGSALIRVSGDPVIGNGKTTGIDLTVARNSKLLAGNLNDAGDESITLLAPSAEDGTILATFDGTAYTKFFVIINSGRKRIAKVDGKNIKVEGGLSLPSLFTADEFEENTFYVSGQNVTKDGTIFSVFAEGGCFTLTHTDLAEGVNFDMGIPVDTNGKEKTFVYGRDANTTESYRYIQFTSKNGMISSTDANNFLTSIKFHKINNKPIKIRINLETVPFTGTYKNASGSSVAYELNKDVFYLDGSFYLAVLQHKKWSESYNLAKKHKFNGLDGYLMTITSEAENKFIYDQLFKNKGIDANYASAWLGASRSINQSGTYDSATWSISPDYLNDYWNWVCGPEAGKMFYTKATAADGGVAADKEGGGKWYVSWSSGEPNSSGTEFCAQYCGTYIWNDLNNVGNASESSQYYVKYYVVEFTPYETTTGVSQVATKPRLHAEQIYE